MSLAILSARWVVPVTSPVIDHGAVLIDGAEIRAVGKREELRQDYPEATFKDLGEVAILPGLVNVHTHLELTLLRGRVEESRFQPWIVQLITLKAELFSADQLLDSARLGCLEAIRSGITTVADTADSVQTVEALREAGLRGIVYQECFGPARDQAAAAIDLLREKLDRHQNHLAKAGPAAAARLRIGISPHAPYSVSDQLYRFATRLAIENNLDLALHAAESRAEELLLQDGSGEFGDSLRRRGIAFTPPRCSTMAYLHQLGVLEAAPLLIHGVTIDEADLSLLAGTGARLAHCPKSNAKFGHGVADLHSWQSRGLAVGLGTDSVVSNNSLDLLDEARFCTLLHRAHRANPAWPEAAQILRLLTIDGARALHLADQIGSLEPGKRADLIAIDLSKPQTIPVHDPVTTIIFSASARDVVLTMVDGQTLYDGVSVSTIDEHRFLPRP
ncbi:MAG: amidohydrolase family protein [Acidobacteriota bacterium]